MTSFIPSMTLLINSFGPVTTGDKVSYSAVHVPIIHWTDVEALIQNNDYKPYLYTSFVESFTRNKTVGLTLMDPNSTTSSPWWTIQTNHSYAPMVPIN